jgi:hypothetical protein
MLDLERQPAATDVQSPYYNTFRDSQIDDIELARDMALAMDPYMSQAMTVATFAAPLLDSPEATFRRTDRKVEIFHKLAEAEKTEDDERLKDNPDYNPHATLYEYIEDQQREYLRHQGAGQTESKGSQVTNGFVADLAARAISRHQYAADKAGNIVFFTQRTRENIAFYEATLSARDRVVFAPLEEAGESSSRLLEVYMIEDDPEAQELHKQAGELAPIHEIKVLVQGIARIFGIEALEAENFSRDNVQTLAALIKKDGRPLLEPKRTQTTSYEHN